MRWKTVVVVLVALVAGQELGGISVLYYLVVYALTTIGAGRSST